MLQLGSSFEGLAVLASDGRLGTVSDLLFDDSAWHIRWMVGRTGPWLARRTILIHPSAVGQIDQERRELAVRMTRAPVRASPDILLDEPVSRQIEYGVHGFKEQDPEWGNPRFLAGVWGGMGLRVSRARLDEEKAMHKTPRGGTQTDSGDPHLRSVSAVIGSQVQATDGIVGHVRDVVFDESDWNIRHVIVGLRDWGLGKQVLLPPAAIRQISWSHQDITLSITRAAVKASPVWHPTDRKDRVLRALAGGLP